MATDGDRGPTGAVVGTDRPTFVSAGVAAALAVVTAAALLGQVGPSLSVWLALSDAALFTASLWLVERDRGRAVAFGVAGALALFVGASFVAAVGYATLDAVADLYPVSDVSQVRPSGLRLASTGAVVLAGTVATVGAAATVGNVLRRETVWDHAKLAVKTFVVPLAVAAVLLVSTLLTRLDDGSAAPLLAPVAEGLAGAVGTVLAPPPGRTAFLTLCPLVAITALAVDRAVAALAVDQLTADRPDDRLADAAAAVQRRASQLALVAGLAIPVALVEAFVEPATLAATVSPAVYDALVALSTAGALRWVPAVALAVAVVVATVAWGVRRIARTSARDVAVELTPFLGGGVVVAVVAAVHGAVVPPALDFVAGRLPGEFAVAFSRQSASVVEFYGTFAVVMAVAALLVGLTALLSLALALVSTLGLLPEDAAAPALAAGGTFAAAAFAAGAGVGPPLVLAGLVAGLVVWDAGEFGLTLGREVGRASDTRAVEAVHLAGTVAVGALAALLAWAVYAVATGATVTAVSTLPFAVALVVTGLFLLITSLR